MTYPAYEKIRTINVTVVQYQVYFNTNGGTSVTSPISVDEGSTISAPTTTKEGYTFDGWWDSSYTTEWDFQNDTVIENVDCGLSGL